MISWLCLSSLMMPQPGGAVILFSGDNSANTSAPDLARQDAFNAVARVCNADGSGTAGSAVHLRGKYLLTAQHVALRSHVTFDGVLFYARDTAFELVTFGSADIKLIKLVEAPDLPGIPLYTGNTDIPSTLSGSGRPRIIYSTGTLIGWGRGRAINDAEGPTWNWGDSATENKRWGTNRIESSTAISYSLAGFDYNYTALTTKANSSSGTHEAAAALYDSGSGLFIDDGGGYTLAGITTAVDTDGSSTFADVSGDANYFVRITEHAQQIEAALPDTTRLADWKIDHSLYGAAAENTADSDGDGISQLLEFALGGNPQRSDTRILPTQHLVQDGGNTYLELHLRRPVGLQGIRYTPQTTTDLSAWPGDATGITATSPVPQDNGDGSETLVYRRSQAMSGADKAFIRIAVTEIP